VTELTPVQRVRAYELAPLLGAVEHGDVWLEADGSSVETAWKTFGVSDPIATVTEEVDLARRAGFIELVAFSPSLGEGGRWELTEVGRAARAFKRETHS
jgi:hypothetical protein